MTLLETVNQLHILTLLITLNIDYIILYFTLDGESFIILSYILLFFLNKRYTQLELFSVERIIEVAIHLA